MGLDKWRLNMNGGTGTRSLAGGRGYEISEKQ